VAQAQEPDSYDEELARIDASIADLKIRDLAAAKERTQIASKIQAAQFQRDILAHANQQKKRSAKTTRKVRRRAAEGPPSWAEPGTPYPGPPGAATDGVTTLVDDPPPTEQPAPPRRSRVAPPPPHPAEPHAAHPPETSSQSVQNILLGLSALVLGVAAIVFAGATSNALGRAVILAIAAAIALVVAPGVARRGLTSTGETLAAVGLVLLPMTLFALQGNPALGGDAVPAPVFLGVTLLITAVASFVYAGVTRLAAPRYATVVAVQPVPPLLAYPVIESVAGWALALTAVALIDLLLLTTVIRQGRLVPSWPFGRPVAGDRESLAEADARDIGAEDFERHGDPAGPASDEFETPERPESKPEEPDLIIDGLTGRRRWKWLPTRIFPGPRPAGAPPAGSVPLAPPATPPSAGWLRGLTFSLLCVAAAGALVYASAGLLSAEAVPDAARSGLILVLAAVTVSAAARLVDHILARNIAGGVLALAVIATCARVAAVASPAWTLAAAAAAVAITGAIVRTVPDEVRRGPQYASAAALSLIGLFVAVDALRAALAPVQAARPVWHADTAAYAGRLAEAAGQSGWLLALSALLLTVAAALALPAAYRHEGAVAGVALTALALPASLSLPWSEAPWPLVLAAIGLGGSGLLAPTRRIAIAHIAAAGVVGLFGAAAALSASWLTAAVLTALAGAGVMVAVAARQIPVRLYAWLIGDWASGAAALAIPGAVVTAVLATKDPGGGPPPTEAVTVPALALGFLAVAGTLTYAAVFQVARREISLPMTVGAGAGAVALALAALFAPGATAPDIWVGAVLLAAAGLLMFAKSIDSGRRADRMLDGPDIAAAAATVAICGALARVAALALPDAPLVIAAVVVLIVAFGIRALPEEWRRGPVRGLAVAGLAVAAIAGWQALAGALRIISAPGPIWASQVSDPVAASPGAWQAPIALLLAAAAAAIALPRPARFDVGESAISVRACSAQSASLRP
jgi:hypothetical protein